MISPGKVTSDCFLSPLLFGLMDAAKQWTFPYSASTQITQTMSDKEKWGKKSFHRIKWIQRPCFIAWTSEQVYQNKSGVCLQYYWGGMLRRSKHITIKINGTVASVKMLPVCESRPIIISCLCSGANSRLDI